METIKIPKLRNGKKVGIKGYDAKLYFVLPASDCFCFYAVSIFHDKPHTKHHVFATFDTYEQAKTYYRKWLKRLDEWVGTLEA